MKSLVRYASGQAILTGEDACRRKSSMPINSRSTTRGKPMRAFRASGRLSTKLAIAELEVEVFDTMAPLEKDWRALERDSLASLHQGYDWCNAWVSAYRRPLAILRGTCHARNGFHPPCRNRTFPRRADREIHRRRSQQHQYRAFFDTLSDRHRQSRSPPLCRKPSTRASREGRSAAFAEHSAGMARPEEPARPTAHGAEPEPCLSAAAA